MLLPPPPLPPTPPKKHPTPPPYRLLDRERDMNGGKYPETIALVLWGTDNIKTYGESLAQVRLALGLQRERGRGCKRLNSSSWQTRQTSPLHQSPHLCRPC